MKENVSNERSRVNRGNFMLILLLTVQCSQYTQCMMEREPEVPANEKERLRKRDTKWKEG